MNIETKIDVMVLPPGSTEDEIIAAVAKTGFFEQAEEYRRFHIERLKVGLTPTEADLFEGFMEGRISSRDPRIEEDYNRRGMVHGSIAEAISWGLG